jgi:two-component system, OmpR family, phosphate regulon sensor histidine kinase PhoR
MDLRRSPTFWRLFFSMGLLVLASTGILGMVVVGRVESFELRQVEASLRLKALQVGEDVQDLRPDQVPDLQARVVGLFRQIERRITLLDAEGRVLADSTEGAALAKNERDLSEIMRARNTGSGTATRFSADTGQRMMYAAQRIEGPAPVVAYVRLAQPLGSIEDHMAQLRGIVWTVAAATAVAAMCLAFWLARRLAQPLQELTMGAERIAAGEYGHKVYVGGQDEVGTLARAFNLMSERLAQQFAQVEEDRQKLRTVLSGMVEGVVAIDAEQRILFANERAAQLLEFSTPSPVGRKLWEVVRRLSIQEVVQRALAGTEPTQEELDWNGPNCKSLVVHVAQLSGPPARGAVLVLHDTSELRRLERVRQEFVANVSHELKTPLSVIKACVETLIDGAVDDAENRSTFLEQIDEQANRLHLLILDLLSLARIESSATAYEFQPVPLAGAVADCLERQRARAEARSQVLESVASEVSPAGSEDPPQLRAAAELTAWADEEAVGQILDNLVDNAIKYTPPGGRIRVGWHAQDGHVCLEVADTGIGIPERDLPRIFERFYRVDKARSRELGGTGLGLSIVKHLVQAMQGSIQATSQLGQGTTFVVRLPRAPGP